MTSTTARAQEITAFYARYASRLQRIVSTKVNAPAQTIEDACQNVWATLLRREDVTLDERGAAWLTTVAIHEGWRLMRCGEISPVSRPGVVRRSVARTLEGVDWRSWLGSRGDFSVQSAGRRRLRRA